MPRTEQPEIFDRARSASRLEHDVIDLQMIRHAAALAFLCEPSALMEFKKPLSFERGFTSKPWWAHQDSNLGPAGYEPAALTT